MNIEVDGYNISYKISGEGPRNVVILQGWGTDLGVYDSFIPAIGEGYRVIQFDFPGFGGSDEPREPWNVDAYAAFFVRFMQALGIDKATLIGHSYGGRVILKLAAGTQMNEADFSFEIERIVLVDSAGIMPKRSASQKAKIRRYKILKKILNTNFIYTLFPEIIDDWRSPQGSADYRNASEMMRKCLVMAVNEDLTELLPKVKQEVLLIWGDADTATPIADAKLMEERIPNAGLAVIPGAGHFCFLEKPAVFHGIMRAYFAQGGEG